MMRVSSYKDEERVEGRGNDGRKDWCYAMMSGSSRLSSFAI